jgi:SSS family solute:Na+ symporter
VDVLTGLDWAVLTAYLVGIVGLGLWAGRGNRRMGDFFLAGRSMSWWAVGLSVMATQISAITFVSTTGQGYSDGMRFLVLYFGLPFAIVILCMTFVPFFYRAGVFTAYEYLEKRFDGRTRTLTSLLFLLSRGLSVGITLYAPSLVLAVILGWSENTTILVMGGTTIAYVLYGGNKSVIWTDVVQMLIIWFGIFVCVGVAIFQIPTELGLKDALSLAALNGRTRIIDPSPSLTTPYTLWSGLIGGLFLMLAYFGTDQSQVQRYLSGRSLTESRLSLLFNAFLKIPMQFLILLTGVLIFVFYHFALPPLLWNPAEEKRLASLTRPAELSDLRDRYAQAHADRKEAALQWLHTRSGDDELAYRTHAEFMERARSEAVQRVEKASGETYNDTNYIFLSYVVTYLPKGLCGLVIAVIFAAAMSTLSGELNSLATASMVDFYKRFVNSKGSEAHDLLVSRLFTAFWGVFAGLVALRAGQLGSAIEVVNRFGSYFYGSILGVFLLAVLTRRASARAATYGLFIGMAAVMAVAFLTRVHFLWYNVIGAATVFLVGLALSMIDRD